MPGQRNRKHIVVVGSGLAGFTAAIGLKQRLGDEHDVTVISKSSSFVVKSALVWLPFRLRDRDDVMFDVRGSFAEHGIRFRLAEVIRFGLRNRSVMTRSESIRYDYLLIATGAKPNHAAVPGLGPRGYTQSITTLAEAEQARAAFDKFLQNPGPVVVGGVQGAGCFAPAYEFLFALLHQPKGRASAERRSLTYLTAEPSLADFRCDGVGSVAKQRLFDQLGIQAVTNAAVEKVEPQEIQLTDGRTLPFAYAMLLPSMLGVDSVRGSEGLADPSGFVRINDRCQSTAHPEVFAAGSAAAPPSTSHSAGIWNPIGCASESMAKVTAHNMIAHLHGGDMVPFRDTRIAAHDMG